MSACSSDDAVMISHINVPIDFITTNHDASVVFEHADASDDGSLPLENCRELCMVTVVDGTRVRACHVVAPDGSVLGIECEVPEVICGSGRPTTVCIPESHVEISNFASYISEVQGLESASVDAFEKLAVDLTLGGAPISFAQRCRDAALDERFHAALTGRLAYVAGGEIPIQRRTVQKPRCLDIVAQENVVDGCAQETVSAMIALHQARFAVDSGFRRVMSVIARDELSHATLSWDIARWCSKQLGERWKKQAQNAYLEKLHELQPEVVRKAGTLEIALGLPSPKTIMGLLDRLCEARI